MRYQLTTKEKLFMIRFLSANECGANTPDDLLGDNYSCLAYEDIQNFNRHLNDNQIGGFLSSLEQKGCIYRENDNPDLSAKEKEMYGFPPILWWASTDYLESLHGEWSFTDADFLLLESQVGKGAMINHFYNSSLADIESIELDEITNLNNDLYS